jgi:hypothetical protein
MAQQRLPQAVSKILKPIEKILLTDLLKQLNLAQYIHTWMLA